MVGVYQGDGSICADTVCTGACCTLDQLGTCLDVGEDACDVEGGSYYGVGTECIDITCPIPPPNDECADALPLAIGDSVIVDNTLATDDAQSTATCGTGSVNQAVWYNGGR